MNNCNINSRIDILIGNGEIGFRRLYLVNFGFERRLLGFVLFLKVWDDEY